MKKWWLLFTGLVVFYSCLDNDQEGPNYFLNKVSDDPNYRYEYLPIDSAITPESFTFGETDTITMAYSLPNGCYSFDQIYNEVKGTTQEQLPLQQLSNWTCFVPRQLFKKKLNLL